MSLDTPRAAGILAAPWSRSTMGPTPPAEVSIPFVGYDEATLRAARDDSFLLVDAGLAVAARWVARAAPGLRLALPTPASPDEDTARYYRHYGLPGHRAAMRALLDDAQAYADRAPERAPGCVEVAGEGEGGDVTWLVGP